VDVIGTHAPSVLALARKPAHAAVPQHQCTLLFLSINRLTDQRKDQISKRAMFFPRPQRQLAPHFRGQPEGNSFG